MRKIENKIKKIKEKNNSNFGYFWDSCKMRIMMKAGVETSIAEAAIDKVQ